MKIARPIPADDVLTETSVVQAKRWNLVLVFFMRVLALAWLAKGLAAWATILAVPGFGPAFEGAPTSFQAITIYFAMADIAAAVGLWLAASWGGMLWLLAVMSHLILAVFFPRFVSNSALILALFIVSIALYLTFSWLAAIDE